MTDRPEVREGGDTPQPEKPDILKTLLTKLKWALSHCGKLDQFGRNVADFVHEAEQSMLTDGSTPLPRQNSVGGDTPQPEKE